MGRAGLSAPKGVTSGGRSHQRQRATYRWSDENAHAKAEDPLHFCGASTPEVTDEMISDVEGEDIMDRTQVPLLFCDAVGVDGLDGTGESVQLTFHSPVPDGVGKIVQVPAARVAMTKLAFMGLVETVQQTALAISKSARDSKKTAN